MIGRSCDHNRTPGRDREGSADRWGSLSPTLSGALRIRNHNRLVFSRGSRSVALLAVSHRSYSLGASFRSMVAASSPKEKPLVYSLLKKWGWISGWISGWILSSSHARAVSWAVTFTAPRAQYHNQASSETSNKSIEVSFIFF